MHRSRPTYQLRTQFVFNPTGIVESSPLGFKRLADSLLLIIQGGGLSTFRKVFMFSFGFL
jgi:hypothetical protein